jgi:hypothetical protein
LNCPERQDFSVCGAGRVFLGKFKIDIDKSDVVKFPWGEISRPLLVQSMSIHPTDTVNNKEIDGCCLSFLRPKQEVEIRPIGHLVLVQEEVVPVTCRLATVT